MLRAPAAHTIALVSLIGLFAGCTDNPLPLANAAEAGAAPGVPTSIGLNASILRYAGPEHSMIDRWENGTFSVTESNWPVGGPINMALGRPSAERRFDLKSDLPPGVPALVRFEVDASTRGGDWPQGGDIDVGIRMSGLDFISADWETPYGGRSSGSLLIQSISGAAIELSLFYSEVDASAEIRYTMHIQIMTLPEFLPPAAIAAITMEPGELLVLDPLQGQPQVTVYDGGDQIIGVFSVPKRTEIRIPSAARGGEIILVNREEGGPVQVSAVRNDTSPLRAVGFEWVSGAEKPLAAGTTRWDEKMAGSLVGAGLWIYATNLPHRCENVAARVEGPAGDEILDMSYSNPRCIGLPPITNFGMWSQTPNGWNAVAPGSYKIEVSAPEANNLVAQMWYLRYVR
jgi:hypothetical protein